MLGPVGLVHDEVNIRVCEMAMNPGWRIFGRATGGEVGLGVEAGEDLVER